MKVELYLLAVAVIALGTSVVYAYSKHSERMDRQKSLQAIHQLNDTFSTLRTSTRENTAMVNRLIELVTSPAEEEDAVEEPKID